jgi:Collagen triple helix repeat (20 copies)
MRRHLSYANVVATLALVFAMSGGALAAKHYLLSSTRQIKPSVLKQLRGRTGPRGAKGSTGVTGAPGLQGPRGEAGSPGPAGLNEGLPVEQKSGATILIDSSVGVRVTEDSTFFDFRFFNTNSSDTITVNGVVETLGNKVESWDVTLQPGESAVSPSNAAQTRFVDVAVVRGGVSFAASPMVHVTCGVADDGAGAADCVAVR